MESLKKGGSPNKAFIPKDPREEALLQSLNLDPGLRPRGTRSPSKEERVAHLNIYKELERFELSNKK